MDVDHGSYIIAGIALGIICITVAVYALKYRSVQGSSTLFLIMTATIAYSIPYLLQIASVEFNNALFWYNVSLPGANLLGPAWLMFAMAWTGEDRKINQKKGAFLHISILLIPLVVCIAAWTNPAHYLYGRPIQNSLLESGIVLDWNFGVFYWIGYIYSYLLSAIGTVILISKALRRLRLFYNQTILILVGAIAPLVLNVAYKLGFSPIPHLDLAPFGFMITGILWGYTIFFYRFLKVSQLSQKSVFERMPVGMIVLDFDNWIVDINPAACEMVGLPIGKTVGHELPANVIRQLFGNEGIPPVNEEKKVIQIDINNEKKYLNTTLSPFLDNHEKLIGLLILLNDISAERKIQAELIESEYRLRHAQQVGRVGNWEMDMDTRMIWASDEAYAIYGLDKTSETIPISVFNEIQVEKYRPILTEALGDLIQKDTPYDLVYEIKGKTDGQNRFIHTVASTIKDSSGKIIKVVGVIQDVTERKKAELDLTKSQTLYRNLIEKQVDPVCRWLPDGKLTFVNEAYCRYFDKSEKDLLGSSFFTLIPEETRVSVQHVIDLFSDQKVDHYNNEEFNFDKNGNQRWMVWSFLSIRDQDEKITEFQSVGRDITERKQAEFALQQSEERFKQLAKIFPETIYEADLKGKITYLNSYGFENFSLTQEDLDNGLDLLSLVARPDQADFQKKIAVNQNGFSKDFIEFRAIRKNGEIFDSLSYSGSIIIDGSVTGTRGFILDISQRKKIEQALAESESNFHTFFDTIDDIIIVASPEGKIIAWNAALQKRLGYSAEDLSKMHVLDINPKESRAEAEVIFDDMLSGKRNSCPLPLVAKNHHLIPAETRIWLGKWNGRTCVYGVSKDLTMEQEAKQRFESLFRNNPALMALTDVKNRKFIDVNNSFLTTLGYTKEDVLGKTAIDLGLFVDFQRHQEAGQGINNDGSIKDFELKVKCKDGRILDGLFYGETISIQGSDNMLTVMIDITERKLAEQALQISELQFRALFEQAAVGVAVIDSKNGAYQRLNQKYCDMLGFSAEEIMAKSCESITHPEDVELSKQMFKDLVKGSLREYSLEKRYIHKDGHVVWVFMNIAVMWAVGEEPTSLIMVVQDISNRKAAEAAMRESDAKMRAISESAQDAIIMMDPGGKISYWNPAAETIFGYSNDEAIGQQLHLLIAPQRYMESFNSAFPSFSQTGQGSALGRSLEMEARRKDGMEIPIRLSLSNFQMNGLWYAVGIISDISDTKKAARELQDQYQFANQIINTMGQGLTVTDAEGRFEFINPAYGRMFGYDPDSLIGKKPQDITLTVDHDILAREWSNRKAGLKTSYENRLICSDGRIADVLITSVPRESDGKYSGAIAVITDLSEQKRYQKIQGVIYKIAQATVAKSGIDDLYISIHSILQELLPVENFYIALYDEESDLISYPYVVDQYDPPPAPRKPGRGLTEYVLRIGKPVLVTPEVFNDLVAGGEVESVGAESVDWVGSPLIVDGKIIGVMAMQSYTERVRFSEEDMKLLEFVSNQVGLAIVRKRAEEMQIHQSTHDRLTGLYNRQYYETEISRLQQSRRFPISILMMDVDNLKKVNDQKGHSAGDELLKTVARILISSFRPEDMVARIGGDEFVAVLPETDIVSASLVVNRLLKTFEKHNRESKPIQAVSISIGFSCGDQYSKLTEVFKEADQAMYIQKEEKKNSINA